MGAARIDRTPSRRQASASARESVSESSQRKGFPLRMHSPDKPESTFTRVPSGGPPLPTLARHIMGPLSTSAIAAPVPRMSERARSLIVRSAAFKSEPSELNSYWIVFEAAGGSIVAGAPSSGSKLMDRGSRVSLAEELLPTASQGDLSRMSFGAVRLGAASLSVSHSSSRWRASSGNSENRTPARPSASAQARQPVVPGEAAEPGG